MLKRVNLRNSLRILFFIACLLSWNIYSFSDSTVPSIAIHTSTTDFAANEDIVFSLEVSNDVLNDLLIPSTVDVIDDGSTITSPTLIENTTTVQANIENSEGDIFPIVELYSDMINTGDVNATQNAILLIDKDNLPGPGEYTLNFIVDGTVVTQNFTWGVLALNTNKDYYLPGETVHFSMSVLDNEGDMVCDSDLTLRIQDPLGTITELSTASGTINSNIECNYSDYLLIPDYSSSYQANEIGQYSLELYAQTSTGAHTIYDFFEVKSNLTYEISRFAPTRIYPPNEYPVILEIKANKDFSGNISEYLPFDFQAITSKNSYLQINTLEKVDELSKGFYSQDVLYGSSYKIPDKNTVVTWNVNFKKGEVYKLAYAFVAPNASPAFYTIDPLRISGISYGGPWGIAGDQVTATPDNSVFNATYNVEHQGNSRNIVFINDAVGYLFYIDSTGIASYSKTLNGGITWGTAVTLTAQTDCVNMTVWYDRWTPGNDGTKIHIAFLETSTDDVYYENIDTNSSDTQKGEVLAINRTTTTHTASTDSISITAATDSDLYIAAQSSVATSTSGVSYSQNTGTSWSATSSEGLDDVVRDYVMLMPLASGDVMLLRWDTSADDIQSKEYEDGANTWGGSWDNIDTIAVEDPNASATDPHTQTWAATIDPDTYNIYRCLT